VLESGPWIGHLAPGAATMLFVAALTCGVLVATVASARGARVRASAFLVPALLVPLPEAIRAARILLSPPPRLVSPWPELPDGYLRDVWMENLLVAFGYGNAAWTALAAAFVASVGAWGAGIAAAARNERWSPRSGFAVALAGAASVAGWPRGSDWRADDAEPLLVGALAICAAPAVLAWATAPRDGLSRRLRAASSAASLLSGALVVGAVRLLDESVAWWPAQGHTELGRMVHGAHHLGWTLPLLVPAAAALLAAPGALREAGSARLLLGVALLSEASAVLVGLSIRDAIAAAAHPDVAEAVVHASIPRLRAEGTLAERRGDPVVSWRDGAWSEVPLPLVHQWPLVVAPADLPARELARRPWFQHSGYLNVAWREEGWSDHPRGNGDLRTLPLIWDAGSAPERLEPERDGFIRWNCTIDDLPGPRAAIYRRLRAFGLVDLDGRDAAVTSAGVDLRPSAFEAALLIERPERIVLVPGSDWTVATVLNLCQTAWDAMHRNATDVECVLSQRTPEEWLAIHGAVTEVPGISRSP
jgi:hypothetical protein